MALLESLFAAPLAGAIVDKALGAALTAFDRHQQGQITREQMQAAVKAAGAEAAAAIETAWAEAAAKMFAAAQETVRASFAAKSWLTRNVWAFVVISQTLVLLWYQIGLPLYVWVASVPPGAFPRTGDDLLKWAYAIVVGCLGIGAWQMSRGAAAIDRLAGKK